MNGAGSHKADNQKARKSAAHGSWKSPLTAELIFGKRQTPGNPTPWNGGMLFLLTMPNEGNAFALMFADGLGKIDRVSPAGFNLRTRVHEYGGLPYGVGASEVFFCNFEDQEIYRQRFDTKTTEFSMPEPVTDSGGVQTRYADLVHDPVRNRLVCVREAHGDNPGPASQVRNALVAIGLEENLLPQPADSHEILFDGSDFVAGPSLSGDGALLAFVTWSHPNMPWDDTEIRCSRLNARGLIEECFQVDEAVAASKLQPRFDAGNHLYFLSDNSGFWNLARVDSANLGPGCSSDPVYPAAADCCGPPWELGNRNYALGENGRIFITLVDRCLWQLHEVAPDGSKIRELERGRGLLDQLRIDDDGVVSYVAAGVDDYPAVLLRNPEQNPGRNTASTEVSTTTVYRGAIPDALAEGLISRPRHFEFRGKSGDAAYGLLYTPANPDFEGPSGELPPLLVNVHGGPTGTARAALNPMHQFWTSRGFAVLDINHRGSTGYGRKFRQALYEQWGVIDIEDVIAAVEHLIDTKQVDGNRAAIRGGSAGGYVVLASLATCDLFSAGVSYYGVADLELLAQDTHKFESRYLDRLIGPYPQTIERYKQRSPINRLDEISAPVLILQGTDDKVVPPSQAELLHAELKTRIQGVQYISFEGEGHGFRKPANQIRALEAELEFYSRNLECK